MAGEQTGVCLHCLFVYSTVAQWRSELSIQVVMVVSGSEKTGYGADGSLAQGLVWQADPRQRPEDLCRHVLSRLLHSPTPSFSWRSTTALTATHVIGYK